MSKSFDTRIEKLTDVSLKDISGGKASDVLGCYSVVATPVGVIGALSCSIAGFVCQNKASKYMWQGDKTKSEKYSNSAKKLGIATISSAGVAASGVLGFFAADALDGRGY